MDNGKENTKSEIAFRYINLQNLTDLLFKAQNLTYESYMNVAQKAQKVVCELYDKEQQSKKYINIIQKLLTKLWLKNCIKHDSFVSLYNKLLYMQQDCYILA